MLKQVDISHNRIRHSASFRQTISRLFSNSYHLVDVNVADAVAYLPIDTFASNVHLEKIDLSQNKLQKITFSLTHLLNLEVFDIRNNSIERLDKLSRKLLDKLYNNQRRMRNITNNSTLLVDMGGNPFTCDCQSIDFLKWFASSPMFSSTRHLYSCATRQIQVMNAHIMRQGKIVNGLNVNKGKF